MDEENRKQEEIQQPALLPRKEFIPDFGEEEKTGGKSIFTIITIGIVISLLIGTYQYITYSSYTGAEPSKVAVSHMAPELKSDVYTKHALSYMEERCVVPNVKNMTEKQADKRLKKLLVVEHKYSYSDSVKKGKVISQSIKAGTLKKKGIGIVLTISRGKKVVVTPKPVITSRPYIPSKPVVTKKPQEDDDFEVEIIAEE